LKVRNGRTTASVTKVKKGIHLQLKILLYFYLEYVYMALYMLEIKAGVD
jgi:hypothetical protein